MLEPLVNPCKECEELTKPVHACSPEHDLLCLEARLYQARLDERKKIVEWLEQYATKIKTAENVVYFIVPDDEWQSLKESVE